MLAKVILLLAPALKAELDQAKKDVDSSQAKLREMTVDYNACIKQRQK